MVQLLWKKGVLVDLEALSKSRLPGYLFPTEVLEWYGWDPHRDPHRSAHGSDLDQSAFAPLPQASNPKAPAFLPGSTPASNLNEAAFRPPFLHVPSLLPDHNQVQTVMSVDVSKTAFPQELDQRQLSHDSHAYKMIDHSPHGRQALEILKEKLAHANTNKGPAAHIQDANIDGDQHTNLPRFAIPDMKFNSHTMQTPYPENNDTTRSSSFAPSRFGLNRPSFSDPDISNRLTEISPTPRHQDDYQDTMLSGPSGDLAIATSASAGAGVGRDVFSNDHLSSEMVPLEDPAEALALSQSKVPIEIRNQRTRQLNLLTSGSNQCPTAAVALHADNFPFVEGARLAQATPAYGVIRLRDIPEGSRRCEILAIMGRNAKVLNDKQEPVHIIIERVNAATIEAYVEFMHEKAAEDAIEKLQQAKKDGRAPRLGDQPVQFELSSQAALMKTLFPQAKGVQWISATPHIIPAQQIQFPWDRFKGFITVEEMNMLAKHAESNKSWQCPQRPYECMISILRKMPWYTTDHITVFQRQSIYDATIRLIKNLQKQIRYKNNLYLLNEQLLERLWVSAMLCHGFTVTMKDNIAYCVNLSAERMRDFNMPRFPELWVHTHSLVPKPGAPLDVLEWYIAVIREMTSREVERLQPNELRELRRQVGRTTLYWGYYWKVLRLDDITGPTVDDMTLGEMARREFHVMTGIFNQAFGGQQAGGGQQHHQLFALLAPGQQANFGQHQYVDDGQYSGPVDQ